MFGGRRRIRRRRRPRRRRRRRSRGCGGRVGHGVIAVFAVHDRRGAVGTVGRSRYYGHGVVVVGQRRLTTIVVVVVVVVVKVVGARNLHGRYHFRFETAVLDVHDFGRRRFDRRLTATAAADPVDGRAARGRLHVSRFPAVVVAAVLRVLWRRRRRRPRRRRLDDRRLDVVQPRYRVLGRPHRLAGPERRYRRFARGLHVVLHADHVVAVGRRLLMRMILRRRVPVHRVAAVVLLLRPGVASRRSRPAVPTPVVQLLQHQLLLRMVFADAVQMVVVMVIELTVRQRRRLVHDVVAVQRLLRLQLWLLREVLLVIIMMRVLLLLVVVIFVIIVVVVITVKVRIWLIDS